MDMINTLFSCGNKLHYYISSGMLKWQFLWQLFYQCQYFFLIVSNIPYKTESTNVTLPPKHMQELPEELHGVSVCAGGQQLYCTFAERPLLERCSKPYMNILYKIEQNTLPPKHTQELPPKWNCMKKGYVLVVDRRHLVSLYSMVKCLNTRPTFK